MTDTNRRLFVKQSFGLCSGFVLGPSFDLQPDPVLPLDTKVVKEFVTVAHSNFDKVKEILTDHPHVLNSAWDWGDGDFETAAGAAGHVGNKDIANHLIEQGARYDIFVLTMFGKTAIVKALLEEYPKLIESIGPHGFTLLHHAKKGGAPAQELYDYLESKGLKDMHRKVFKRNN